MSTPPVSEHPGGSDEMIRLLIDIVRDQGRVLAAIAENAAVGADRQQRVAEITDKMADVLTRMDVYLVREEAANAAARANVEAKLVEERASLSKLLDVVRKGLASSLGQRVVQTIVLALLGWYGMHHEVTVAPAPTTQSPWIRLRRSRTCRSPVYTENAHGTFIAPSLSADHCDGRRAGPRPAEPDGRPRAGTHAPVRVFGGRRAARRDAHGGRVGAKHVERRDGEPRFGCHVTRGFRGWSACCWSIFPPPRAGHRRLGAGASRVRDA